MQGGELVLNQRKQCFKREWLPRASWLALLSLAWMQLAIAGHQFEHSAAYTDFCEICVQADRLDDVVPELTAVAEVCRPAGFSGISPTEISLVDARVSYFHPRAPPTV